MCIVGVKLPRVLSHHAGRSRGRSPIDRPAARQHLREFDTNNTHTIMFDPDYNMMPPFFHSNQYSAHEKQFKVWIESNRSLRCHVTTLSWRQVWQSPPPPVTKMRVPVFCGRLDVWNRTASSATRGDNEVDHAVCLQAEFQMHTVLSNENDKFYTTMIYLCFSRSVCFSMGSPAWWRFGLCSSGSSLVSRWRDAPLVHAANFKSDVADVNK